MTRAKAQRSAKQKFADALLAHVTNGTRPGNTAGEPWTYEAFASEIVSSQKMANARVVSPRSVSNWCNGRVLPKEISPILTALFGEQPSAKRADLDRLFRQARREQRKSIEPIFNAKPDPAGGVWKVEDDHLAIARPQGAGDELSARNVSQTKFQRVVERLASELASESRRLNNARHWDKLSECASELSEAVRCEPEILSDRLPDVYTLIVRLGGFLDTDARIRGDSKDLEEPLPSSIHGALRNLLRVAAPWIRGFPTVVTWDDAAGKFLTDIRDLLKPARDFVKVAREESAITGRDAESFESAALAAEGRGQFAAKASAHTLGYAKNLLIEAIKMIAADEVGDNTNVDLVGRLDSVVTNPASGLEDLMASLPEDLRLSIQRTMRERYIEKSDVESNWMLDSGIQKELYRSPLGDPVFQAALNGIGEAILVVGPDGRVHVHNSALNAFFDLSPDVVGGIRDMDELISTLSSRLPDIEFWNEFKDRFLFPDKYGDAYTLGETHTSDGRTISYQLRPLPGGTTLVGFADVTGARKLESALADRSVALADAERLNRDFVGNVSYELRTPLTTIIGYSELLERSGENLSERGRAHAAAVRMAATQLARSIDDVLDMAQIDADEMALDLDDVRVADIVDEAARRWLRAAEEGHIEITVAHADNVGVIRADSHRLAQILDHLTQNAIHRSPPGHRVKIAADRKADEMRISVTDWGEPIPIDSHAHLFERFVARERGGPGLGMALVKALTEMHGGWVSLETGLGVGTTFTCHLPVSS